MRSHAHRMQLRAVRNFEIVHVHAEKGRRKHGMHPLILHYSPAKFSHASSAYVNVRCLYTFNMPAAR